MLLLNLVLLFTGVTIGEIVRYDWNITYTNANPDNLYERRVVGVNGKWP